MVVVVVVVVDDGRYTKEVDGHRKSNFRLMQENLQLIKEIKGQREANKTRKHALQVRRRRG